jgi:hypothetical protein
VVSGSGTTAAAGNWKLTRNREKYYKSDEELKGMKKPM